MSYSVSLAQRILQLRKMQADLPNVLTEVARNATIDAIAATQDATPPKADTGRGSYIGVNTITGELQAHWDKDSVKDPMGFDSSEYVTVLGNNMAYASYVNDGHRLDRHFVPGLYIDPDSKLLSYDPERKVGLMVGTKTKYVKGEHMVDKGKEAYEKSVIAQLDQKIVEMMG